MVLWGIWEYAILLWMNYISESVPSRNCAKSVIETLEQGMNYVQKWHQDNSN